MRAAMEHGASPRVLAMALLAGLGLCAAASVASAANGRPPEVFLPVGISGAVYVVSGYLIARRRPANRIGYLMMLVGLLPAGFVVARYLLPASEPVNNASQGASTLLLAYVLLAYPSGSLTGRAERITLAAGTIFFAVHAIAVLVTLEPAAHGVSRCPPCAPNPLRLTDLSAYPVVQAVGDLGAVVIALAFCILTVRRWYRARGTARRVLAPVLFGGFVIAIALISTSVAFLTGREPDLTAQVLLMLRILVPIGLAVTFVRIYATRGAVAASVVQLGASQSAQGLEVALRRALGDPDLIVARWSEASRSYLDREGEPVDVDGGHASRSALRLERDGQPLGVVIHDQVIELDPTLVRTVADAARLTFDTTELRDRLRASGGDVSGLPEHDVTFLFGDLERSTELLSAVGTAYVDVLAELRRLVGESADRSSGRVVDAHGDECFLAFTDPRHAVEAALEIQRRMRMTAWPLGTAPRLRIGLHRGAPELTPDGYVGIDVHRAARVMSAASGGQILASGTLGLGPADLDGLDATLVPLGAYALKGLAGPESLSRIDGHGPVVATAPRAAPVPVG